MTALAQTRPLAPVNLRDAQSGEDAGWVALPEAPVVGDLILIPGAECLWRVVRRCWKELAVPDTRSMVDARLYRQGGYLSWVAVVAIEDAEVTK